MSFSDNNDNVNEFINMSVGYDGKELINKLKNHLPTGSSVLELGMGAGKDLDILSETYKATGSDFSSLLLTVYQKSHPNSDLIRLDEIELNTERQFDGIYSNKVLHHVAKEELVRSFNNQLNILNDGGIAFHSFWHGNFEENHHGLRFLYYTKEQLQELIPTGFKIVETELYTETNFEDSIYVVLKKI